MTIRSLFKDYISLPVAWIWNVFSYHGKLLLDYIVNPTSASGIMDERNSSRRPDNAEQDASDFVDNNKKKRLENDISMLEQQRKDTLFIWVREKYRLSAKIEAKREALALIDDLDRELREARMANMQDVEQLIDQHKAIGNNYVVRLIQECQQELISSEQEVSVNKIINILLQKNQFIQLSQRPGNPIILDVISIEEGSSVIANSAKTATQYWEIRNEPARIEKIHSYPGLGS
jgi:hypothetical protein